MQDPKDRTSPKDPTSYTLTDAERMLLAEYEQAKVNIEFQKQGALQLIVRSQRLEGTWSLVGGKLIKQEEKK